MKIVLVRAEGGFVGATPDDQHDYERARRRMKNMKVGQFLRIEYSSPRNGKHHRKYHALLQLIMANSDVYDTIPKAHIAIKLAAGYFDVHIDPDSGEAAKVPHSIKYESMSQEDFSQFYQHALNGVLACILPQFDERTALRLLDEIVDGWITEAPR